MSHVAGLLCFTLHPFSHAAHDSYFTFFIVSLIVGSAKKRNFIYIWTFFVSSACYFIFIFFRFDRQQQLPTSSFLGEGASELRGGELCPVASRPQSPSSVVSYDLASLFARFNLTRKISFGLSQQCKIYLCGTKSDLIAADRSLRQVDYHDAQDFAEGMYGLYRSGNRYVAPLVFEVSRVTEQKVPIVSVEYCTLPLRCLR